jgi:hypothetical protein
MTRLRVLFADDQIPDEDIPDEDLVTALEKKYPDEYPEFISAFLPMRQAVKTLRDGYDVTIANTYKEALRLVKENHFDIAIVDLRWDADEKVPRVKSTNAGWTICDAIEEADKDAPLLPTFQIVYSSRLYDEPQLGILAAQRSKLPIYKSYDEAGNQALLAVVNFIEKHLSNQSTQYTAPYEDKLLEVIDVPDDFYKKLIGEINHLYQFELPLALSVLIRKLFENLIIDILRKRYGTQDLSLYYDTSRRRFQDFSVLIKNLEVKKADFQYVTGSLDNKFINEVDLYRETGNAGAHSLDAEITIKQFQEKRSNLNYLVQLFFRILKNLP